MVVHNVTTHEDERVLGDKEVSLRMKQKNREERVRESLRKQYEYSVL